LNGITSLSIIIKIYQAIQKLLVGGIQTDRQTGYLISFHFWKAGKKKRSRTNETEITIQTELGNRR
jgi:hypothetical protein